MKIIVNYLKNMIQKVEKVEILPEYNLLRRYIFPNPPDITFIKDNGKICSTCFHIRPNEGGISVDIEHLTTYEKSIQDREKYRLLLLNAGDVQNLELITEHDPEPNNYAHSLIKGNIDKKISRKLAEISKIINYSTI
jgi:hypothetical protein